LKNTRGQLVVLESTAQSNSSLYAPISSTDWAKGFLVTNTAQCVYVHAQLTCYWVTC